MKTDELDNNEQQSAEYQPPKKIGLKTKAEIQKISKESHMNRRRNRQDSSEQQLIPQKIPQKTASEPTVVEGFENQVTKVVIIIPYSQMLQTKFQHFANTKVLGKQVLFSIEKNNQYLTVMAKLFEGSNKMQIDEQQKNTEPNSHPEILEQIRVLDIRGKYVYMGSHDFQNKNIKGARKQLNSMDFVEILKFKLKNPISDLFIYFNLRIEEYICPDYVGLINQGNTCYMNSYLQTLYHMPAIRNLVDEAQIQDQNKFLAALQQLFHHLDNFEKAASPEDLIKSFGWGKQEASIQQDAQQFSCLFFDALEHNLKNSAPKQGYKNRTIQRLFKGSLNHYIRCKDVGTVIDNIDFRNENYQDFLDLQVTIAPTLEQSLDLYTSEVHLQGQNAYETGEYGKQQAFKGVRLCHLPPILMIQLKRFEYDFNQNKNVKILSELEYKEEIDFGRWTISGQTDIYELYAVLVHQGSRAQSGHYFNYVKVENLWYKFNDENVQLVTKERALNFNFGGFHETIDFDSKEMKVDKKFIESKTTAYMLVYVKQSLKDQLMKADNKIPEWIQQKNINKLQMQENKRQKKNYFHNVSLIDWQTNLKDSICSDNGFLNEDILENSKSLIAQIPKEANLEQWLIEQKIIEAKNTNGEDNKKKTKKTKCSDQQRQNGIYLYSVADRQILVGNKSNNKVHEFFKGLSDPILLKAPFQAKKDEYLTVIKCYKVQKKYNQIQINFYYDSLIAIKKDTSFQSLKEIMENNFLKKQSALGHDKCLQFNYYLEDQTNYLINILTTSGPIPAQSPKSNQLLICIVQHINFQITEEQKDVHSFKNYYEVKKNIISLTIAQEKGENILAKKNLPGSYSLSKLRLQIFFNLSEEKKSEYISPENIVLKAKLKKGSKIYSQVFQPEWETIKDIVKIDDRIEFTFSALSVESRLLNYMIQFQYCSKGRQFSDPITLVVSKDQTAQNLVNNIKKHPLILEMFKNDGISEEQAQIVFLTKTKTLINDIVSHEGKVHGKGDLDVILRKQKNAVAVVMGRTDFQLQTSPMFEINKQQIDPVVNILLHHISNSGEKIGHPIYIRVDRRMELEELRNKVMELIKDEIFFWEGKAHICSIEKAIIELYGKDTKKVVDLSDLQTREEAKRLKIEQKSLLEAKRKKNRQPKQSSRKQSLVEQPVSAPLEIIEIQIEPQVNPSKSMVQNVENIQNQDLKQQNLIEKEKIEQSMVKALNNEEEKIINDKIQVITISDNSEEEKDQEIKKDQEEINSNQPNQNLTITKVSEGPETILSVFPRLKVLKIRVLHSYLTKPNYVMKFHVYD